MINYDELRRVLKHIETHPEQHNQSVWFLVPKQSFRRSSNAPTVSVSPHDVARSYELTDPDWACKTTACVAGWTVIINGWRPIKSGASYVTDGSRVESVSDVARELLGLTADQADHLFYRTCTLSGVRTYVEELLATEFA